MRWDRSIAFPDAAQSFQGQIGFNGLQDGAFRGDGGGVPTGGNDLNTLPSGRRHLQGHAFQDAIYQAGIAEEKPRLHGGDGVPSDDVAGAGNFHPGQLGGVLKQRLGSNSNPRRNDTSYIFATDADGIEGGRRTKIDHHGGAAVAGERGHGVDNAICTHLLWIIGENGETGTHPRFDEEWIGRECAACHLGHRCTHRRHHTGDSDSFYLSRHDLLPCQEALEEQAVLVAGSLGTGAQAPGPHKVFTLIDPHRDGGVADVKDEKQDPALL